MCVHKSLVEETNMTQKVWTDAGSGGAMDATLYAINGSPFVVCKNFGAVYKLNSNVVSGINSLHKM